MPVLNRYRLGHVTQFSYDGPVSESYNELRLRPRHDEGQSCLSFRLTTTPTSRPAAHLDFYGNWVHQFHILPEHRSLRVESEAVVLVHPPQRPEISPLTLSEFDNVKDLLADDNFDWLSSSVYCPLVPEIQQLSFEVESPNSQRLYDFAHTAASFIHERFKYQPGATHVHSSILDCVSSQSGVCQDFSHLLLAMLRVRGIPARYVSGYLVPRQQTVDTDGSLGIDMGAVERVVGGQASHAWVEALIPGMGWIGLDPTAGRFVEQQHIRIAYGRDYGDVPPVRGVYKGHAGQSLSVDVLVRPALDDDGAELLQEQTKVPPPKPEGEWAQPQQQQQ